MTKGNKKLGMNALMRRPEFGAPLRFIDGRAGSWIDCLTLNPQAVDQAIVQITPLIAHFPTGELRAERKLALRRVSYREQGSTLHAYVRPLAVCPEIKADPARARVLSRKLSRCESIRYSAGRAVNSVLDLRLMLGALQWYILQKVLTVVVARMEAKDCSVQERELLQRKFSKLLLNKEALLQSAEDTKAQRDKRKQDLQNQVTEVEKKALVDDVMNAIRLKLPIPTEKQELAATYFHEMNQKQATPAGPFVHQRQTPR